MLEPPIVSFLEPVVSDHNIKKSTCKAPGYLGLWCTPSTRSVPPAAGVSAGIDGHQTGSLGLPEAFLSFPSVLLLETVPCAVVPAICVRVGTTHPEPVSSLPQ